MGRRSSRWAYIDLCVQTKDRSECWQWPWGHANGYPTLGANRLVMHVALEKDGRQRPDGAFGLHSCDNPGCWNPDHLRWGTHAENMADAVVRHRFIGRRHAQGSEFKSAKLNEDAVREIRRRYQPGRNQWTGKGNAEQLAAEFGVSPDYVRKIAKGRTWRHVPDSVRSA